MTGGAGPELMVAGPVRAPGGPRRRRTLLLTVVVVVSLVLAGVGISRREDAGAAHVPGPSPHPTSSSGSTRAPSTAHGGPPVVLRTSGPAVAGFGDGDLFARSADTVYRLQLGSGRLTATPAGVGSSSPVGFVAGRDGVVLRPLDFVPGLLVPDDRPARPLRGQLRRSSQILPGPGDRVWVGAGFDGRSSALVLTDFDGRPTATTVRENGYFVGDGRGGLLLVDTGGVWQSAAGRWHRISTGSVLATGAHHELLASCDAEHVCVTSRYDRRTRTGTRLPAVADLDLSGGGALSADGRYVAGMTYGVEGPTSAAVVDLTTGRVVERMIVSNNSGRMDNVAIWSPTGHRLLTLDDGQVVVLDAASGRTSRPDLGLPALLGLVVRPPRR